MWDRLIPVAVALLDSSLDSKRPLKVRFREFEKFWKWSGTARDAGLHIECICSEVAVLGRSWCAGYHGKRLFCEHSAGLSPQEIARPADRVELVIDRSPHIGYGSQALTVGS